MVVVVDVAIAWVLPAYAGMIRIAEKVVTIPNRAPRVCGDDPINRHVKSRDCVCSPRMRG